MLVVSRCRILIQERIDGAVHQPDDCGNDDGKDSTLNSPNGDVPYVIVDEALFRLEETFPVCDVIDFIVCVRFRMLQAPYQAVRMPESQ